MNVGAIIYTQNLQTIIFFFLQVDRMFFHRWVPALPTGKLSHNTKSMVWAKDVSGLLLPIVESGSKTLIIDVTLNGINGLNYLSTIGVLRLNF